MSQTDSLRCVVYQEATGVWIARGLEHDLAAEARSIGETVRALAHLVEAHSEFDERHHRTPLSAFRPAPQSYWNAYSTGTPISLSQFAIHSPGGWELAVVIAHCRPSAAHFAVPVQVRSAGGRR